MNMHHRSILYYFMVYVVYSIILIYIVYHNQTLKRLAAFSGPDSLVRLFLSDSMWSFDSGASLARREGCGDAGQ